MIKSRPSSKSLIFFLSLASDKDEIDAGSDPNDSESTPENVDQGSNSSPFPDIPGFPVAFLFSILIFISFGLVIFMKKQLKN